MFVEELHMIAKSLYILAGLCSCVVIVLFLQFRIWRILGNLTGVRKKRELQAISKTMIAEEHISQRILGMSLLQEEKTGTFIYTEDTEVLEQESVRGNYCLLEKIEYIGSEMWIE